MDDAGDVPGFRWRPDPARPRAQNAAAVARVAGDVAAAVHAAASGGRVPLVLGGDRTVSVGLVAGLTRWCGHAPALIYLSGSPGLLTPQTGLTGNLDGMVLAHLLGVAGHLPELAGLAAQVPLLTPERVVLYGADIPYSHHERVMIDRLGLHYFPARDIVGPLLAGHARATAEAAAPAFAVHFGVDAPAFDEAPLADVPEPVGISLADAAASVATFAARLQRRLQEPLRQLLQHPPRPSSCTPLARACAANRATNAGSSAAATASTAVACCSTGPACTGNTGSSITSTAAPTGLLSQLSQSPHNVPPI